MEVFTVEVCEIAVRKRLNNEVKVVDFEVIPRTSQNFIVKVTVYYEDVEKTYNFFAKPGSEIPRVNTIFYQDFKRTIPKFDPRTITPQCYYNNSDLVFFDDLTTQRFHTCMLGDLFDLDHVRAVLSVLAKFHSVGFAYEDIRGEETERPCRLDEEYNLARQNTFLKDAKVVDLLSSALGDGNKGNVSKITQDLEERQSTSKYYRTLCHGNLTSGNIMFHYDNGAPDDCRLINFEAKQYASPMCDVLQVLFFNTSDDLRDAHLEELLSYYHNSLKKELKKYLLDVYKILPQADLQSSIGHFLPLIKLEVFIWKQESQLPASKNLQELKRLLISL